jgi:hypothetical protein
MVIGVRNRARARWFATLIGLPIALLIVHIARDVLEEWLREEPGSGTRDTQDVVSAVLGHHATRGRAR